MTPYLWGHPYTSNLDVDNVGLRSQFLCWTSFQFLSFLVAVFITHWRYSSASSKWFSILQFVFLICSLKRTPSPSPDRETLEVSSSDEDNREDSAEDSFGPSIGVIPKHAQADADRRLRDFHLRSLSSSVDLLGPFRHPAITRLRQFICDGPLYLSGSPNDFASAVEDTKPHFVRYFSLFSSGFFNLVSFVP